MYRIKDFIKDSVNKKIICRRQREKHKTKIKNKNMINKKNKIYM